MIVILFTGGTIAMRNDPDGAGPGIITERDILRAFADGPESGDALVGEHVTASVVYAEPDWSLDHAAAAMIDGGFRHLVVMRGCDIAGVISKPFNPATLSEEVDHRNGEEVIGQALRAMPAETIRREVKRVAPDSASRSPRPSTSSPASNALVSLVRAASSASRSVSEIFGLPLSMYLLIPGALFEIGIAFWLIIKGFQPAAIARDSRPPATVGGPGAAAPVGGAS